MKKIVLILCIAALSAPSLTLASEVRKETGKDTCLLNSENCPGQTYSMQEIMAKLQNEINKGNAVYTTNELKRLQSKLDDSQKMMIDMTSN